LGSALKAGKTKNLKYEGWISVPVGLTTSLQTFKVAIDSGMDSGFKSLPAPQTRVLHILLNGLEHNEFTKIRIRSVLPKFQVYNI
jgi:hypothetical protein